MLKHRVILLLAGLVMVPAWAVAAPQVKPKAADMTLPIPNGLQGDPEKGRDFYMQNCFTCHGVTGAGDGPRAYFINPVPRNFLLEDSRMRLNRPRLYEVISNGSLRSEMPAWNKVLNDQQIADVTEFVFQAFIQPGIKGSGKSGKK